MEFNELVTIYGPAGAVLIVGIIVLWRDNQKLRAENKETRETMLQLLLKEGESLKKLQISFLEGEHTIQAVKEAVAELVKLKEEFMNIAQSIKDSLKRE